MLNALNVDYFALGDSLSFFRFHDFHAYFHDECKKCFFFCLYRFRAKFVPDFLPTHEVSLALPAQAEPPSEKYSPPTPEEAERIISNFLPV